MRVKVAILDDDVNYTNRLVMKFTNSYADKLEVHSFSDMDTALRMIKETKTHVLLSNTNYCVDVNLLPSECGFAYLVDSNDISSYMGQKTICKYQRVDLIYKEILSIFYEKAPNGIEIRTDSGGSMNIIAFMPCAGGVGSSTAAVACAKFMAQHGKSVLYINVEKFGDANLFFKGEGSYDFSDVISALKFKRNNIAIKIESSLRLDVSGVSYFASAKHALDIMEMNEDDIETLRGSISRFDVVIIDSDFGIDGVHEKIIRIANQIILVSDGAAIANAKLMRVLDTLGIIDQQKDIGLMSRLMVMYNRFGGKGSSQLKLDAIPTLGLVPQAQGMLYEQVVNSVIASGIFAKLL